MPRHHSVEFAGKPKDIFPGRDTQAENPIFVALIGNDLESSSLPALQAAEAQALGLELKVDLLDPLTMARARPHLPEMLGMLPLLGFSGACITSPYKRAATAHADGLSVSAQAAGAVTTVVFRNGMRLGHNTTAWAFRESLRNALDGARPGRVLLLGAGAGGSAVGHALRSLGVQDVMVVDPNGDRAEQLAQSIGGTPVTDLAAAAARADGIVNATPIGTRSRDGMAIPAQFLHAGQWVADLVETPVETDLIGTARAIGCRTIDGKTLMVFRAMRDLQLLTGRAPDPDRIRASADRMRSASAC